MVKENVTINDLKSADASGLVRSWVHCREMADQKWLECPPDADNKYRSLDGTCNNLISHFNGAAWQPFRRILPSVYGLNLNRLLLYSR